MEELIAKLFEGIQLSQVVWCLSFLLIVFIFYPKKKLTQYKLRMPKFEDVSDMEALRYIAKIDMEQRGYVHPHDKQLERENYNRHMMSAYWWAGSDSWKDYDEVWHKF